MAKHMGKCEIASRPSVIDVIAIMLFCAFTVSGIVFVHYHFSFRIAAYALLSCVVVLGVWLWSSRHAKTSQQISEKLFPVVFVFVGLLFISFFGPNNVPDEKYHYGHSYAYMNAFSGSGSSDIRVEDALYMGDDTLVSREMTSDTVRKNTEHFHVFATDSSVVKDESGLVPEMNLGSNPPQVRIASALGMLLAKSLNLSGVLLFYMGRLFNFMFCAVVVVAAVRLAPIGKSIMMAVALLPMSMHLFASYSYDGPTIAFAMLFLSLMLRMMSGKELASSKLLAGCLVMGTVLAPCKTIYSVLLLLALFVPADRFSSKAARRIWQMSMIVLPSLIVVGLRFAMLSRMSGIPGTESKLDVRTYEGGPREEGHFYTFGDVLTHPFSTASIFARTLFELGDSYLITMVGARLGQLQPGLRMLDFQAYGCVLLLLVSTSASEDDDKVLTRTQRLALAIVGLLGVTAAIMSMMFAWTFQGEQVVQGVQGRYFLPILPAILLALKNRTVEVHTSVPTILVMCLGSFNCYYLAQMFFFVLGGFSQ